MTFDNREDHAALAALFQPWPNLTQLIAAVVTIWPEHAAYLQKSFSARSHGMMETSDQVAGAILKLADGHLPQLVEDYRWLGARIREEEIDFARTGRYRYSSFEETNANVYSNGEFMERYMHGLLLSHVLWYMHASSLHFFRQRLEARIPTGGKVLEVGSGHGLLLYLALKDFKLSEAHGWDLSEVSLAQTKAALSTLGEDQRAHFAIQDMHQVDTVDDKFELLILSHILEHLDDPVAALQKMRPVVAKGGHLFVNVPLNAPMPDHIILLETPDQALDLIARGGFQVNEFAVHTTQGARLPRALRQRTAVTVSIIAEPM